MAFKEILSCIFVYFKCILIEINRRVFIFILIKEYFFSENKKFSNRKSIFFKVFFSGIELMLIQYTVKIWCTLRSQSAHIMMRTIIDVFVSHYAHNKRTLFA